MTLVVFVILCKICVRFLLLASSGGFFTAERGGRRQFQLAVPCQPGRFDPTLLICEKKRGVEPPRRSCPKEPLERGSSGLFLKQRDRGPSGTLGLPGTEIFPVGRWFVLLSGCWSGVRQTWKTRLGAKQISSGNFFARGLLFPTALGTPSPPQFPPQGFLQSKNALRRRKTSKSAARQSGR